MVYWTSTDSGSVRFLNQLWETGGRSISCYICDHYRIIYKKRPIQIFLNIFLLMQQKVFCLFIIQRMIWICRSRYKIQRYPDREWCTCTTTGFLKLSSVIKQLLLPQVNKNISYYSTERIFMCYIVYKKTLNYFKFFWTMKNFQPRK